MAQQELPAPPAPPATTPIPGETPESPTAPTGTPTPFPAKGDGQKTIPLNIEALRFFFSPSQGLYQFFGDVTMTTADLVIHADELTYNDRTRSALARGNVSITVKAENTTFWGNVLEYAVTTQTWRFLNASVQFPAGYRGTPFVAPIFVNSENMTGLVNLSEGVRANNATTTTCDLTEPHYFLRSRRIDIFPGDKLIARDNDFYLLGNRILHVPYFVLSLQQRRTPIVPEVGRNEQEGYYVRALYQYVLNRNQYGGVRLDETQKLGLGLGVDHFWGDVANGGEAFGYARQGGKEYVLRLRERLDLERGEDGGARSTVALNGDIRRNSLFTVQPTTITILNAAVNRNTGNAVTNFTFTSNKNQGPFSTDNLTSLLNYNLQFGRDDSGRSRGSLNTSLNYSRFARTGLLQSAPPEQKLWTNSQLNYPLSFANFNVRVDHLTDIEGLGETGNRFTGIQRLPETTLTFTRSGGAAGGDGNLGVLSPFTQDLTVGWGIFKERLGGSELNRYAVTWNSPVFQRVLGRRRPPPVTPAPASVEGPTSENGTATEPPATGSTQGTPGAIASPRVTRPAVFPASANGTTFSLRANLKQTVYGDRDTTAQYAAGVNASAKSIFGKLQNDVTYIRRNVEGFPALSFDTDYPSESVYDTLRYISGSSTTTLTTGRDLRRSTWSDATLNSFLPISPNLTMTLSTGYDLNFSRWRDLSNRFSLGTDRVIFNLGTQYSLQFGALRSVKTELAWQMSPRWSIEWLGGYDVSTRQYLYNEFLLKRDLHCWDIALYYSQEQRTTYLYVRLKALNTPLPQLGIGRGGQRVDTTSGIPL